MRTLLQCIALVMAALWLPATQHCALDALGLLEAHGASHNTHAGCTSHSETPKHPHDTCDIVESSQWLNTSGPLDAPAPQVSQHTTPVALAYILLSELRIPQSPSALQHFSPSALSPDWLPSRHFTERAAPPSRAPSLTQA